MDSPYHPNPGKDWKDWGYMTCNPSGCKHNPSCKIDSNQCSKRMSSISDLCLFHRARMATHKQIRCGCSEHTVIYGDHTGRCMFNNYYKTNLAVIDIPSTFYCCGPCQNTDSQQFTCGDMNVCAGCSTSHDKDILEPID